MPRRAWPGGPTVVVNKDAGAARLLDRLAARGSQLSAAQYAEARRLGVRTAKRQRPLDTSQRVRFHVAGAEADMAAAGVGAPEIDAPPPSRTRSHSPPPARPPTVTFGAADTDDVVVLAAVAATAHGVLVYVPLAADGFGAPEAAHARNGRRAAAVDAATAWLPELDIAREAFFLAGELDLHADGSASAARRVTLVVAPCSSRPSDDEIAKTASALANARARGDTAIWATIDALADGEAPTAHEGGPQYRIAAAAIAKVTSYIRPTTEGPRFLRIGAAGTQLFSKRARRRDMT